MSSKQFTAEKIIGMQREAEVALTQEKNVREICRRIGVEELLGVEIVPRSCSYPVGFSLWVSLSDSAEAKR
jgi:hypothetical protein